MTLDDLDRRILDIIQTRFPVEPRPFHVLAEEVGSTEQDVLERIRRLEEGGVIRRIGPVFDTERMGYASTLCAASVTPDRVDGVAAVMTLPAEGVYKIQVHFPMGGTMA